MPGATAGAVGRNGILARLPPAEAAILQPALQRVPLVLKDVLQDIGEPLTHLWFPAEGVCSVVTEMSTGEIVEVATVGHEGFVGVTSTLGARQTAQRTMVQIPGEADRISLRTFRTLREKLPVLQRLQLRYALALMTQIAQSSACNRLHPIESRCARWLLHTHDRVSGDKIPLTHEFLAQMLGVTRPSVTIAAGILQKAGLIDYARGVITILDRGLLEDAACECYAVIRAEFDRLNQPD